jgi:mono/diheme cytochrome c family protein
MTVPDGLATRWGEEKLVKFLSTGEQADAPMPAFKLTVGDARAVVAYLRSLPGKR